MAVVAVAPTPESAVSLRIVLLAEYYRPRLGGVEVFLGDLAEALAARGHGVRVVTTTPEAPADQGGRVPFLREGGEGGEGVDGGSGGASHGGPDGTDVEVVRVSTWRLPSVGVPLSPRLPGRLRDVLAADPPDVVHVHASIGSAGALAGGWAAHALGLPLVVTVHSQLGRHAWVHRLAHGLTGWGHWPHVVTGPSRAVAGDVARTVERPVSVLPNGVDVAWWRTGGDGPGPPGVPAPRAPMARVAPTSEARPALVAVQRLKGRKRGTELVRAVAEAQRGLPPGRRPTLTVVGEGPRLEEMRAEATRRGVDARFLGAVPRTGVRDALRAADAFVLACADEAFGIAAAEARAVGLPVVAFRTGALPLLVEHGVTGLLVDTDAGLARAVRTLCGDPALLRRLSEGSRRTPPPCDWSDVVRRHEDVYRRAMEVAGAAGAPDGRGTPGAPGAKALGPE